jgi:hypothetical protein
MVLAGRNRSRPHAIYVRYMQATFALGRTCRVNVVCSSCGPTGAVLRSAADPEAPVPAPFVRSAASVARAMPRSASEVTPRRTGYFARACQMPSTGSRVSSSHAHLSCCCARSRVAGARDGGDRGRFGAGSCRRHRSAPGGPGSPNYLSWKATWKSALRASRLR